MSLGNDPRSMEPSAANAGAGDLNAEDLSAIARSLYTEGSLVYRKMQHWRPYICPFERLVGYVQDGSRVLDIGCGGGLLLGLVSGLGRDFEGVGVDVSEAAIDVANKMARKAAATKPARLSFQQVDLDTPWPAGEFDVVFLIDVLHHVGRANQRSFLKRVIAKVKRGGVLVYKDMCLRPWWRAQANRLHDLVIARELISYAPIAMVESWAGEEGMHVIARENPSRFWYGHELRVLKFL